MQTVFNKFRIIILKSLIKIISEDVLIDLLVEKLRKSTAKTELEGFYTILSENENIKFSWSLEISHNDKHL